MTDNKKPQIVFVVVIEDINRPGVGVFTTYKAAEDYGESQGPYWGPYEREVRDE